MMLLAAVAVLPQAQGAKPMTLDEAIAEAEKASFAIRTAQSNLEKARLQALEASGTLGPKVQINSSYQRYGEKPTSSFQGGSTSIDSKNASVTASLPIDLVGVLKRLKKASLLRIDASNQTLVATKQDLRLSVRKAYIGVLRTNAFVTVAEQALVNAKERLVKAQARLKQDEIAPIDALRFETSVRSAEGDLVVAQNTARLAQQGFNLALSRAIDTPVQIAELDSLPNPTVTAESLVAYGQKQRPEVKGLEQTQKVLSEITEAQRGGLLPSVALSLSHNRYIDSVGPTGKDNSTAALISVSFPIFDSGVTKSKIRQAREDENQVKIQLEQLRLSISQEVRAALRSLSSARERLETAQKQLALAKEVLRISNVRNDAGEGTVLDVVDAQTQLTSAQNNVVSARYDYLTSFSELQRAIGSDDIAAANAGGEKR
ncbi:MAG: TolC family protein [Fimbriimonas sp.]